jgi:hypothetical protein
VNAFRRILPPLAVIAVSCTPPHEHQSSPPPMNVCPDHACQAYAEALSQSTAICSDGACITPIVAPRDLVFTLALPEDSVSAPNRTFAFRLADLQPISSSTCATGQCMRLPVGATDSGSYTVQGSDAVRVRSTLVSAPLTSLPVHVTYRALWPPNSPTARDAFTAGLPIYPVEVFGISLLTAFAPGPAGGPTLGFQTQLQSQVNYERTIAPDSPFDQEFPPDVNIVVPTPNDNASMATLDITMEAPIGPTLPRFALSSTQGTLDGWTAYLRDSTTTRPVSPIKPLSGTTTADGGLLLPTNHHPPPGAPANANALWNTDLVMVPPVDASLPTEVFSYPLVFPQETYALLPPTPVVTVNGTVDWSDGKPAAADVFFEAVAIYAAPPPGPSGADDAGASPDGPGTDGGPAGPQFQPQSNFEYLGQTTAVPVPGELASAYTVALPRGVYRAIVRPRDAVAPTGAQTIIHQVTIVDGFDTGDGTATDDAEAPTIPRLLVHPATNVAGTATIADGRVLAGALVEALPLGCPAPAADAGDVPPDSTRCMPRSAQAITDSAGAFALFLDPGSYVLRVEPAEGTRLPWVSQRLSVPSAQVVHFSVPAPTRVQVALFDPQGPPIANAIVRGFSMQPDGRAVEIGRAITDATGRFDLYLDPAAQ